jgi:hypothetical protein
LLQAHRVAFAATGRLDDARCDAGVNNSGQRGAVRSTLSVALEASPTLGVISSSNEPSSRLMKGRIDATQTSPVAPRLFTGMHRHALVPKAFFGVAATFFEVLNPRGFEGKIEYRAPIKFPSTCVAYHISQTIVWGFSHFALARGKRDGPL